MQSADNAEKFITTRKIDSFESLAKFTADKEQKYSQLENVHLSKGQKLNRLKELSNMQSLLQNGEKITPKQWKVEKQSLQSEYDSIGREQTKTATELAYAEVISYNKKNLEREPQNESRQHNRQKSKTKRREEELR